MTQKGWRLTDALIINTLNKIYIICKKEHNKLSKKTGKNNKNSEKAKNTQKIHAKLHNYFAEI